MTLSPRDRHVKQPFSFSVIKRKPTRSKSCPNMNVPLKVCSQIFDSMQEGSETFCSVCHKEFLNKDSLCIIYRGKKMIQTSHIRCVMFSM